MMDDIAQAIFEFVPKKRKSTPSGWTKFNSICCIHNGQTVDTRMRSGIKEKEDGIIVHCFNCKFYASYTKGELLPKNMREWLSYAGATDSEINALILACIKGAASKTDDKSVVPKIVSSFPITKMPKGTIRLVDAVEKYDHAVNVLEYIDRRGMLLSDCEWMWSPEYPTRFLVPFRHRGNIVGFGGRRYDEGVAKYYTERPEGYVYGLETQADDRKYVIVCEGLLDAITIDGVSILGGEINRTQENLINALGKQVIYVPDRDSSGKEAMQAAIRCGWYIAFPAWDKMIKDINQAALKYGRLLTLLSIIHSAVNSNVKIHLHSKKWFPREEKN